MGAILPPLQVIQIKHNFLPHCLFPVLGHSIEPSRLSVAGGVVKGGYTNDPDNPWPRYYQESQNRSDAQRTQDVVLAHT